MFLGRILPREQQGRFKLRKLNQLILASSLAILLLGKKKKAMLQNGKSCALKHSQISTGTNGSCEAPESGIRNQESCNQSRLFIKIIWLFCENVRCTHTHTHTHTRVKITMANKSESKIILKLRTISFSESHT